VERILSKFSNIECELSNPTLKEFAMKHAFSALSIILLTHSAIAAAQPRHRTPQAADNGLEFRQFDARDRSQWGVDPGLQPNGNDCAGGSGSAVWGRGNSLLGYSCSDSANGS
jgi:hypothetical protein